MVRWTHIISWCLKRWRRRSSPRAARS